MEDRELAELEKKFSELTQEQIKCFAYICARTRKEIIHDTLLMFLHANNGCLPVTIGHFENIYLREKENSFGTDVTFFENEYLPFFIQALRESEYEHETYETEEAYFRHEAIYFDLLGFFEDWLSCKTTGRKPLWNESDLRGLITNHEKHLAYWNLFNQVNLDGGDSWLSEANYPTIYQRLRDNHKDIEGQFFPEKLADRILVYEQAIRELMSAKDMIADIEDTELGHVNKLLMFSLGFREWLSVLNEKEKPSALPVHSKGKELIIFSEPVIKKIHETFDGILWANMNYRDFYTCFDLSSQPTCFPDLAGKKSTPKFVFLLMQINESNGIKVTATIALERFGIKGYDQQKSRANKLSSQQFFGQVKTLFKQPLAF